MAICKKCHTSMSKEKLARHVKNCVPEGTKGFEHYRVSKSYPVDPTTKKRITYERK